MTGSVEGGGRVRVPADVERPDRILAGLTARQLAILAAAAVILWAGYAATRTLLPPAVYAILAIPVAAIAVVVAVGRIDGAPADRFLAAAIGHWRRPGRLVPARGPLPAPPTVIARAAGPLPAPLRLPLVAVHDDGTVDLGADGQALILRAAAAAFSLRIPAEQQGMVGAFARWLNSLSEPVQLIIHTQPQDLRPAITALEDAAPALPHPALEAAAKDHARFLAGLATEGLLSRQVLVVLRQGGGADAGRLARRASEAQAALAAAGVSLAILDGPAAGRLLAATLDPANPHTVALRNAETPVTFAHQGSLE